MSPLLPVIVHAPVQGCSRAGTILPSLISRKWVNFFVTHCSTIATRTSLRCAVHCGILTLSTPPPVGLRARVWEAPRQVAKGAVGRVLHVTGGRWMIAMTVIKGMPLTATAHCWRARRQLQRRQGASGGGTAVSRSGRDDDHRKGGARGGRAYQRAHKAAHQRAGVVRVALRRTTTSKRIRRRKTTAPGSTAPTQTRDTRTGTTRRPALRPGRTRRRRIPRTGTASTSTTIPRRRR